MPSKELFRTRVGEPRATLDRHERCGGGLRVRRAALVPSCEKTDPEPPVPAIEHGHARLARQPGDASAPGTYRRERAVERPLERFPAESDERGTPAAARRDGALDERGGARRGSFAGAAGGTEGEPTGSVPVRRARPCPRARRPSVGRGCDRANDSSATDPLPVVHERLIHGPESPLTLPRPPHARRGSASKRRRGRSRAASIARGRETDRRRAVGRASAPARQDLDRATRSTRSRLETPAVPGCHGRSRRETVGRGRCGRGPNREIRQE